jgi:membrane protease YdiL (CAAX protease family)
MLPEHPEGVTIPESEQAFEQPLPHEPVRIPFWGYLDVALVLGIAFALIAAVLVPMALVAGKRGGLNTDSPALLLSSNVLMYAAVYASFWIVFRLRYERTVFASLGWRRTGWNYWLTVAGGVALAFAISALAALLHAPKVNSPLDKLTQSPLWLALFGVMAVTLAPLFEEMFFRGFLQPLLSRTFGIAIGIAATALCFGALHGPEYGGTWQYILAVSVVGVVLGIVRARANSLIPSTVTHACYNAAFIVALAITKTKNV